MSLILVALLASADIAYGQNVAPDELKNQKESGDAAHSNPLPNKRHRKSKNGKERTGQSITLDESVVIDGERPAPGVQFIESKEERMRRAMEGLLQDTAAGRGLSTSVSRPVTLKKGGSFSLLSLSVQGMAQDATRRELSPQLSALSLCWRKNAHSAQVKPQLYINDKGRVRRVKIIEITPATMAFQKCVTAHVRAFSFSAPAAGSGKIEFTIAWKAMAPPKGHRPKNPRSSTR